MSAQEDQALDMLQRLNVNLRKAILDSFPCAYEQYVCISLPGTVVDTREGGSYLPAATGITADQRNAINCNEAMLVDSMVPLDKVMLGPTGKSVTRSYSTALDMLVPRKTDVGTFDLTGGASQDPNSPEYKYTLAMEYLRRPAPAITVANRNDNDVQGAKDSLIKRGIPASTVDMYVQKQLKWSEARVKWDAARNEANEARESHPELQNAAAFSRRQKKLKSAQNELHARWMDWVVNGDKLKVDYCFAVVDRNTIMANIERAKEATRDSMLSSIDGTEWAQVHLEPQHWALLCRSKAMAWKTRHPSNPAHTQLQLESLRSMRESYEAYSAQLTQRSGAAAGGGIAAFDLMSLGWNPPAAEEALPVLKSTTEEMTEKAKKNPEDNELQILKVAYDEWSAENNMEQKTKKQWRIAALEDADIKHKLINLNASSLSSLETAEKELRGAYDDMYKCEEETKKTIPPADAQSKLDQAKEKWLEKRTKLQQAQASDSSAQLSAGGVENLQRSIRSRLSSLNAEVERLESRLARNSVSGGDLPDMITGVSKDKTIEKAKPDVGARGGARNEEDSADVWTNISFTVNTKTDSHKQEEHGMSGSFHAEAQTWWASVRADSSFSKNDKKINDFMASCTVSGSFSAMVVNIKRPWLHAELFQDFDIDIPKGTFLSPGAKTIKHWVETGDTDYNGYVRTNYGKFPAYPTAFIVAADTNLSFKSASMSADEALTTLQTDSSVQASYGCWGIGASASAGGSLKTDDKSSSQHMEVKDGALQISFQAPQIIGWVSEILPELPRGDIPKFGGLNGAPMKGFRANL